MSMAPISAVANALTRASEMLRARGNASAADELAGFAAQLAACPLARQPVVLAALVTTQPAFRALGILSEYEASTALREAPYANAPLAIRARLVLGETPAAISGGLTRLEAHAWLLDPRKLSAASWLLDRHGVRASCTGVAVARWLVARMADPAQRAALTVERSELGPHGEVVHGSFLQRVDELREADLRPSVRETFARCAKRLYRAFQRAMARKHSPLAPAPKWWRPARCARLLLSAAELAKEGADLKHCVASYVGYVRAGDSVIVALDVCGHRSTVEIERRTLLVRQHRGPGNNAPNPLCERALAVLLRRWGRA